MTNSGIEPPATSDNSLAPSLNCIVVISRIKFDGHCSKQGKITFTHGKVVNIYIVYETNLWSHPQDFTLGYSLFEAVKLIINADFNK